MQFGIYFRLNGTFSIFFSALFYALSLAAKAKFGRRCCFFVDFEKEMLGQNEKRKKESANDTGHTVPT